MKQTIHALLLFAAISGTAMITGCVKGDQGDPGPPGNANVIGTSTVTIYPSDWNSTAADYFYKDLNVPAITPDVVDFGAVMVYYKIAANEWMMLPYLQGGLYIQNSFYDYGVMIEVSTVDGSSVIFNGAMTFRVVVIPSSVRKANPNTNWTNYSEVEQLIKRNEISKN